MARQEIITSKIIAYLEAQLRREIIASIERRCDMSTSMEWVGCHPDSEHWCIVNIDNVRVNVNVHDHYVELSIELGYQIRKENNPKGIVRCYQTICELNNEFGFSKIVESDSGKLFHIDRLDREFYMGKFMVRAGKLVEDSKKALKAFRRFI